MDWAERYQKEASTGSTLHNLFWTIWPEGPKTVASDAMYMTKIMTNPDARERLRNNLDYVRLLPTHLKDALRDKFELGDI